MGLFMAKKQESAAQTTSAVKGPRIKGDGTDEFDFVVLGSGPAGIHAAVQASKLKKRVCIVEKRPDRIGGCWIHTGTLPSKTLRESLATIQSIHNHVGDAWVSRIIDDMHAGKLFNRANKVSMQEEVLVRKHLENNNIEIISGYGLLESQFSVRVIPANQEPFTIRAEHILIATGSQPRRPTNIPFDGWRVVDSDEIFSLERVPRSLVIYGAGVIGCEYACIFKALGVDVTIADSRARILQYLDSELGLELQRSMETLGVKFVLGENLEQIKIKGPVVETKIGEHFFESDVLFYAAGRDSCTERIGLERLGIAVNDRGAVVVNEHFQTSLGNIYAAGDAIGAPALASTSSHQGRHVACHAFGASLGNFPKEFPIGVYTIPELSMVGRTEEQLKEAGIEYVVGRATYNEIARGYIRGDSHGLLKILVDAKTHKILGIHIVGDDACNLIHIGVAIMLSGGVAQDLVNKIIFNYPTLAEGYRIAGFNALNKLFPDGVIKLPPKD